VVVQFGYGDGSRKESREGTGAADRRLFCGVLVILVQSSLENGRSFWRKKQQIAQSEPFLRQQQVVDAD
jgi:hypothetical protein